MNIICAVTAAVLNHAINFSLIDIKIFFLNRTCPVWNKLPEQIVSAFNLTAFKTLLSKFAMHTLTSLTITKYSNSYDICLQLLRMTYN